MRPTLRFAIAPLLALWLPSAAAAQWPYPAYPGSPAYRFAGTEGSLRIKVKPNQAAVYVDGYFAGKVEDFDGAFQRLHVTAGQHRIVIYLEGYRSLHQELYISSDRTRTIEGTLERLSPGEQPEAQPVPDERPVPPPAYREPPQRGRVTRRPPPPREQPPPDRPDDTPGPPSGGPEPASSSRFGTLSIRVQPSGATVLIDGRSWEGPQSNDERLIVQVTEGRHRIEVEKEGYAPYAAEIDVTPGRTEPINVSLARDR